MKHSHSPKSKRPQAKESRRKKRETLGDSLQQIKLDAGRRKKLAPVEEFLAELARTRTPRPDRDFGGMLRIERARER